MSEENRTDGRRCYLDADADMRGWFEQQWAMWPERVHDERTTNLSFHHGGVLAYREAYGSEPKMSSSFRANVDWFDRNAS